MSRDTAVLCTHIYKLGMFDFTGTFVNVVWLQLIEDNDDICMAKTNCCVVLLHEVQEFLEERTGRSFKKFVSAAEVAGKHVLSHRHRACTYPE